MINSTSNTESLLRTLPFAGKPAQKVKTAPTPTDTEQLSASNTENLRSLLKSQPEVRPEVVSKAQQLLIDGNYPPKEIIRHLSELLVRSVDLSE